MKQPEPRTAIAIRHSRIDGMGSLRPLLESRGYRTQYRDADSGRLRNIDPLESDILIVLGGPLRIADASSHAFLQEELELIRVRCHYGLPTLGISLGAQLLACALGGRVQPMAQPEIGLAPIELTPSGRHSCLRPLADNALPVLHWHADEIILPAQAQRLASTPRCATQAFRYGERTLGLQFHLEADMDHISARLNRDRHELRLAQVDPVMLRMQGLESAQRMRHACHAVMTRWLDDLDGVAEP